MKPFLILQLREMDGPANSEFQDFLKYGGLKESEVERVRIEKESISHIKPSDYSAIILGGGPSNISDKEEDKSKYQKRFERELNVLYQEIFEKDIPFFGSCYGFGSVAAYAGASISKEFYSEQVGYIELTLSEAAIDDPLLKDLPNEFTAFCGHKEACQDLPLNAVLLASSNTCPIQMIRFGENIYATQFHCELDALSIAERIRYYKDHGYFDPNSADDLIHKTQNIDTRQAQLILKRFVNRYKS